MPKFFSFAYVYLAGWIVFSILPYVYFSTKAYVALLLFFSLSAIYYAIHSICNYCLPPYFKLLVALIAFLMVYGGAYLILGDAVYWQESGRYVECNRYLLWLITSMMSVFPAYVLACKGELNEFVMKIFFVIMVVTSAYAFHCTNQMLMVEALSTGSKQEEFAITAVYCFLSLLPLVVLFKRNVLLQYVFLGVFLFFFVQSAKRGPVILGSICVLLLIVHMFKVSSVWKRLLIFVLSTICGVILYQFVSFQIENSPFFAMRIEQTLEGYTSGRDEYGKLILDYFLNETTLKEFFLGIGAQGTLEINESFAHNDWLAILLEQGLVGFFVYLFYWLGFVYTWFKSKSNLDAFMVITMLLIIGLGKTLFSMYYLPVAVDMLTSSGIFAIALGFYLSKLYPQKEIV